jgi:uncharacterized protein involved in response to NO
MMSALSLRRLGDAPHRLFFFLGTTYLLLTSAWWLMAMLVRHAHWSGLQSMGDLSSHLHPLIMIYGFFPFFIFGFAFTAGPKWLQMPPPATSHYLIPGVGMGAAFILLFPAMLAHKLAVVLALLAYTAFALMLFRRFSTLVRDSRAPDKIHARIVQASLAIGGIALLYAIVALATDLEWRDAIRSIGLWGFLVPLFCTVCHRMLPFFTASALNGRFMWRPWWLLAAMVSGSYLHGTMEYFGATRWLWLVDGPMAFLGFMIVWRWGLTQSLSNRLLAMLHLSFLWLAIGYTLSFVQALMAHAGVAALGMGPMHAVSIGFLASITIAMVTRVTCGHSGRTLAADRLTWIVFLVFQLAAISRLAAEAFNGHYAGFIVLASTIWFVCFSIWVARNAPVYLAPRQDGMPG